MTLSEPLIVESLDEAEPHDGTWVYLIGQNESRIYVARDGKWVPYEKPATPDLWSHLTSDDDA